MKVALFVPCYVDQVTPKAATATVRLLERLGHQVIFPKEQTCCGQPAFNTGYWPEAAELARKQIDIFLGTNADAIVCPSGSCAAMQKVFYPTLLAGTEQEENAKLLSSKTFELSQFLVTRLGLADVGARFPGKAALHPSCHTLRELNARTEAKTLLRNVRDLQLIDFADQEECCGFGGTFAVKMPAISGSMGEIKIQNVLAVAPDFLVSTDSSCLLHLAGLLEKCGKKLPTYHLAEILAAT